MTLVLCAICASLKGSNEVPPHTDCKRSSRKLGANKLGRKIVLAAEFEGFIILMLWGFQQSNNWVSNRM